MKKKAIFVTISLALALSSPADVQDDLVKAALAGDLLTARRLLTTGGKADAPDSRGILPLHAAAGKGKPEVVELLLSKGANPNREGFCEVRCEGHPALVAALTSGNARCVKALLAAKADVHWRGDRLTRICNVERRTEMFRLLRAAGGEYQFGPDEQEVPSGAPKVTAPSARGEIGRLLPGAAEVSPAPPARPGGGKLRLAIVADPAMKAAADLLGADLSAAGVEMLERGDLQKILQEQHLGTGMVLKRGQAAKLGSLAGADALAFLRVLRVGGDSVAESRLVRVSPEIVLSTATDVWPPSGLAEWSKATAASWQRTLGRAGREHAVAVAIADFRSTGEASAAMRLAHDAQQLLGPMLLELPDFILLERAALADVAREQALQGANAFWGGSYVIDGTVEPPLTPDALLTLTLRVQPTNGGATQAFKAQGPRDELRRLLEKTVADAATAILRQAPPPADLGAEASRYFDEAFRYSQRGMFLSAWRSVELSALLGFRSPTLARTRLDVGMGAIAWQMRNSDIPGAEHLKNHGWSEAWLRATSPGEDFLRPGEFIDLALQNARLWHELLQGALAGDDAKTAEALWDKQGEVLNASIVAAESLNTVAGNDEFGSYFTKIAREYVGALEAAYEGAQGRPAMAEIESSAAPLLFQEAVVLDASPQALLRRRLALLGKHFPTSDAHYRVLIRDALLSPTYYSRESKDARLPAENAVRPTLLAALRKSAAPDDQICAALLDYDARNPAKEGNGADALYAMAWEKRQLFIDEPEMLVLYRELEDRLTDSPVPKYRRTYPPGGGVAVRTPAILDLRRRLFVAIAKSDRPSRANALYDQEYHPAGEDAAELMRLRTRVEHPPQVATAAVGTKAPGPAGPPARSFANAKRLPVNKSWTPGPALGVRPNDAGADVGHLVVFGSDAWCFGGFNKWGGDSKARLFRINLPTMKTEVIELPIDLDYDDGQPREAHLLVEEKQIFIATPSAFLVYDRATHALQRNPELHVSAQPVRFGDDLFLITSGNGARGLVRYTPASQKAELLASNRRSPARSPLDNPQLTLYGLHVSPEGKLFAWARPPEWAHLERNTPYRFWFMGGLPFGYQPTGEFVQEALPKFAYDEATRGPTPVLHAAETKQYRFPHISPEDCRYVLLPSTEMPGAVLPLEFTPDHSVNSNVSQNSRMNEWLWTPAGYIITENFRASGFWFLPVEDLMEYVKEQPSEPFSRQVRVARDPYFSN